MYATGNPKSKKALKEAVANYIATGTDEVEVFSPGPFPSPQNGRVAVEGPHYPKPHSWYANVQVENGVIVKVIS